MKLWAISDLHVGHSENRSAVQELPAHPDDWLILAGDLGETTAHLRFVFDTLSPRFRRLVWVPGNHELWTVPGPERLRGVAKYEALVATCREYGVLTPEDPYELFDGGGALAPHLIVPLFTLYDYSFCPDGLTPDAAREWARESGIECVDEHLLHPDPYDSRETWCAERCAASEARLAEALSTHAGPTVLINHFPLMPELAHVPRIPRFSIWCGTRRTADWHRRFGASVVVSGHLHIRKARVIDGVRFEEVSLGYPKQWTWRPETHATLRQILPEPGA